MKAHPAANLFPMLDDDALRALAADIGEHGQREAIVVFEEKILDGRNRWAACKKAGIEPKTREMKHCDSPTAFVISMNLKRRHLTPTQESSVIVEAEPMFADEAGARKKSGKSADGGAGGRGRAKPSPQSAGKVSRHAGEALHRAALAVGGSTRNAETLKAVRAKAPEVFAAVKSGLVEHVTDARRLANMAPEKRAAVLAELAAAPAGTEPRESKQRKSVVAEAARQERVEKIATIAKGETAMTGALGRFPVVYADPPWRYEHVETESRAIENQYPTMDLGAICALPLAEITTDDAILFLWATSPKLGEAMRVVSDWGFTYRTCAVWTKDKIGMGYYFRQQHELLLVATNGSIPVPAPANRPSSIFSSARGMHSAKPIEAVETIERMYPELPKIELFGRSPRPGWTIWGNQSEAAE